MDGKRIFSAFFSYAHQDAKATPGWVEPMAVEIESRVTARLLNASLSVWRDKTHLRAGPRFDPAIERQVRASDILIVLFSPSWIESDYCRKEYEIFEQVEAACGGGEYVVPILLRPADDQLQHLKDEQQPVYDSLRNRQHFGKLAVGSRGRPAALEAIAGDIVRILEPRRGVLPGSPAPPSRAGRAATKPAPLAPSPDIQSALATILAAVGADKGVPLPALREILARLGDSDAPLDPAAIEQRLRAKADEYAALRERLNRLSNDDPRVQELRQLAASLIAAGDFAGADTALSRAEARDLDAVEELETLARRRRVSAAASRAERAATARLQLDYRAAADHYAAAAAILPPEETAPRWRYGLDRARALYDLGGEFGDNAALRDSIDTYRAALVLVPRAEVPLDWAGTQNNLGNALASLGERESGTARLEEAVTAYRAALAEYTRERVPLDWAMTQNNLGAALWRLGERESGTGRLEESVAAYRAALAERTRERVPLDWATTQNNLGTALQSLGARESGTARLEEAVAAYRAALAERTRERVPLQWATTQNNLGTALSSLGARESGTGRLEAAVAACDAALTVFIAAGAEHYLRICRENRERAAEMLDRRRRGC